VAPAILSYKRKTIVPWADRKKLVEALKGVELVVPQTTLDYEPNLRWLRPAFVVHGNDWNVPGSPQYVARQKVIDTLAECRRSCRSHAPSFFVFLALFVVSGGTLVAQGAACIWTGPLLATFSTPTANLADGSVLRLAVKVGSK